MERAYIERSPERSPESVLDFIDKGTFSDIINNVMPKYAAN